LDGTSYWTLNFWIYPERATNVVEDIFSWGAFNADPSLGIRFQSGDDLQININGVSDTEVDIRDTYFETWFNLHLTFNHGDHICTVMIDNSTIFSLDLTASDGTVDPVGVPKMGVNWGGGSNWWQGRVSQIGRWDGANAYLTNSNRILLKDGTYYHDLLFPAGLAEAYHGPLVSDLSELVIPTTMTASNVTFGGSDPVTRASTGATFFKNYGGWIL
jgi:hypothetical protein